MAFVVQAVLSPCVLLFNTVLVDPFKKGFMKFKNFSYPLLDHLLAGKIQRCLKEFKNGKLQAAKLQSFLADLSYELYSFLFNLPSLLPHMFSSQRLENMQPVLPTELLVNLAWTPLVLLDVAIQVIHGIYVLSNKTPKNVEGVSSDLHNGLPVRALSPLCLPIRPLPPG